jgi:putative membrane protein insertion efficiency factor
MALRGRSLLLMALYAGLIFGRPGAALPAGMNGPPAKTPPRSAQNVAASHQASQPLLGAIRFFQDYISPIEGARCQFTPTCSAFGHQAIHRHGPWLGGLMTADRLMRCSYLTDPTLYPQRPDGRLLDPVAVAPGER